MPGAIPAWNWVGTEILYRASISTPWTYETLNIICNISSSRFNRSLLKHTVGMTITNWDDHLFLKVPIRYFNLRQINQKVNRRSKIVKSFRSFTYGMLQSVRVRCARVTTHPAPVRNNSSVRSRRAANISPRTKDAMHTMPAENPWQLPYITHAME